MPCDLEIWWMTLKNNRAPLLCCFQLCAWFHCYMWIQTGVRVRKRLSWVLTSVTLTFDLWPWPFAWTSLLTMVITPENFMMIRWWEHGEKGVTDRRTDRQTDGQTDRRTENTICWAAWSQLKIYIKSVKWQIMSRNLTAVKNKCINMEVVFWKCPHWMKFALKSNLWSSFGYVTKLDFIQSFILRKTSHQNDLMKIENRRGSS